MSAARASVLALVLLLGGALAPPAGAGDPGVAGEKARSLVTALRKADDDGVRRDLFDLGAVALEPLADALAQEEDPAAWTRLAETLESVLDARLAKLDEKFARDEEARKKRQEMGLPVSSPEGATATAMRDAERDVLAAGYAAARTIVRERGIMDELALLARQELLRDLARRLAEEAAAGDEARERLIARLAGLGPLAAPLVQALLAPDAPPSIRATAEAARARAVGRLVSLFVSDREDARTFATDALFGMGDLAAASLKPLAEKGSPDERRRARRLLRRIEWSISDELYRRTGGLLEGFEEAEWRERRLMVFELERQGGPESVPTLRRILQRDPSADVKVAAAEGLARQRDLLGFRYLASLGIAPLTQSPEVLAAIAMDQGIKYLQIRRYEKSIEEFKRVLDAQPSNEIAYYNLACAYSLKFARDGDAALRDLALDYLEKSVEKGFDDVDHMLKDDDLTSLRDEGRFKSLESKLKLKKAMRERGAGGGP